MADHKNWRVPCENSFTPIQIAELKHDGNSAYRTLENEFTKIQSLEMIETTIENQLSMN